MLRVVVFCALLGLLATSVHGEKLRAFVACGGRSFGSAEIKEVRVTPCPETNNRKPCILRKNTNVTIEVDMKPTVSADAVQAKAYWANRLFDVPLPGMNDNACNSMSCPLQPGVQQTYKYNLFVSRMFPSRRYDVRWKFTGNNFNVCFQFPIQIVNN